MQPLLIGNWKMQLTVKQAVQLALALRHSRPVSADVVICPSFTALSSVSRVVHGSSIALGAQNLATVETAALTGEVSALDLRLFGCRYVLVGHSDRRALGETNGMVAQKVKIAIKNHLRPVLCLGETLPERKAGRSWPVVRHQLRAVLTGLARGQRRHVLIAYEPVWAISPGGPISPSQAFAMATHIRTEVDSNVRLLYGGSVGPRNILTFVDGKHFTGALVGKNSLTASTFLSLAKT